MKTYSKAQYVLLRLKAINLKDIAMLSAALLLLQVMLIVLEVTSKGVLMGLIIMALVKVVQCFIDMLTCWLLQDEPKDI